MKKIVCVFILLVILAFSAASCGPASIPNTLTPTTTFASGSDAIPGGNNAFALDLYKQLKDGDGNIFYSPYSIYAALAMTSAGAKENTLWQMASALHFKTIGEPLHRLFNELDTALKSRSKDIEVQTWDGNGGSDTETLDGFRLNIINALWGQEGYPFLEKFLGLIKQYYGGEMNKVDFISEVEKARLAINDWASEQTEGRIKDLLAPGALNQMTRLVLTNAIYFNAQWKHEFREQSTDTGIFHLLDGTEVTVPMMHQGNKLEYAHTSGCSALSLPYLGDELDMIILLPDEGDFEEFENSLDTNTLQKILGEMESRQTIVSLPKFEFEADYKLKPALINLGMADAFDSGKADFSGITGTKELYIDEVIHKSFVSVDEFGTEAAAVTAVIMVGVAAPVDTVDFNADRPFIFLIRDIQTNTILFMGRVMNPVAQ